MDRRTLLKIMGGIAALPALGKAIKGTGIKAIKAAGKVLPKVSGMPEWFSPLVNKIMKEGKDISPKVSRVEDMETIKRLEIPSETGKPEVITLTQNKATGKISIETNIGGVADSPFELSYTPPKTDINLQTGEPVKYPGDFSVIENRPKPDYNNIGKIEFDYDNFDIDSAYSDLERLEKIGTGKIKDVKKMEQRAKGREMINQSPYEDIMDRFPGPPEPDDFADGGLASFANGGKAKKKSKAEESLSKYKSYSEQELLENIEAKYPNQLQSFSLEDYLLNTMPMFEPRDVAPPRSYSPMPNIYDTPRLSQVDLADGGVASMFRERPGYAEGGVSDFELFKDAVLAANQGYFGGDMNRLYNEYKYHKGPLGSSDPDSNPFFYAGDDTSKMVQAFSSIYNKSPGYGLNTTTEIPTIDPFSGQPVSAQDQAAFARIDPDKDIHAMNDFYSRLERLGTNAEYTGQSADEIRQSLLSDLKMAERSGSDQSISQDLISNTNLKLSLLDNYVNNLKKSPEVPTVDPFSGQQVSAQDLTPPTPAAGYTEEGIRKIAEDTASREQAMANAFNNIPTVDPFSGQQVSMQDQMSFTQPQADIFPQQNIPQPPSPVDQFIGERRFQSEADAAARSGIPFTKTIQDYLPNIGYNVPGHMDYISKIKEAGLPQSEYNILGTADLVQRNIDQLPPVLKQAASVVAPAAAFALSIPYEGIQAYQRMQPGSGVPGFIDTYLAENPFQTMMDRTTGASQPLANQIQNLLSPTVSSAQRSQQEAAARVTPRMTMMYGGLTNTIPPDKGPDSQGVESLFRRRYN